MAEHVQLSNTLRLGRVVYAGRRCTLPLTLVAGVNHPSRPETLVCIQNTSTVNGGGDDDGSTKYYRGNYDRQRNVVIFFDLFPYGERSCFADD